MEPLKGEYVDIAGFEDYQISKEGYIYNKRTKRNIKQFIVLNKPHVNLHRFNKYRKARIPQLCSVAQLMLQSFKPHSLSGRVIPDYIDGDRHNIHIDNLQWKVLISPYKNV